MPNIDGGHYFLTALVPVASEPMHSDDKRLIAPSHALRETLATMPTALQSEIDITEKVDSPFARCTRTHFVRMFVIDQPHFNGRTPSNALVQAVHNTQLLTPQPVDDLVSAWLAFIVDFDVRANEPDGGLASYLQGLWTKMEPEMKAIFEQCYGFDTISCAGAFADYITRCQVETTMPFNDYWTGAPPFPALTLNALLGGFGAIAVLLVTLSVGALLWAKASLWWLVPGVPLAALIAAWAVYGFVERRGHWPFPAAPHADLPSVLKALYLQQRFARFAAANQGVSDDALHQAFGAFVATHAPANIAAPTREPGKVDA